MVVYPDRARIKREAIVKLQKGNNKVQFTELPVFLYPDSLRATAHGDVKALLHGIQLRREYYEQTPVEEIQILVDQIEEVEDSITLRSEDAKQIQLEKKNLQQLTSKTEIFATALAAGEMDIESQIQLFHNVRQHIESLDKSWLEVNQAKRDLEAKLLKLKNELALLQTGTARERYSAELEIELPEAGNLTLEISYVVKRAGWKPVYDIRFSEGGQEPTLEIGYLGEIHQKTGEAWLDVELTLSTARPAVTGKLPELKPWFLAPYQPPVYRKQAKLVKDKHMLMEGAQPVAAGAAPDSKEYFADYAEAEVETTSTAVTYRISGKATIPPDGESHKVNIAQILLTPEIEYLSVPKLSTAVHRKSETTNDSPYTLLPGKASIFSEDEYIGKTELELTPPQGTLELSLGIDDRVKVERRLEKRDVDKRLIAGKRRVRYGYEIDVSNFIDTPGKITVSDHIPQPRHEEIKVRLESCEPDPDEHTELNMVEWKLEIPSGGKQTIQYEFTVEYPPEMNVPGLP